MLTFAGIALEDKSAATALAVLITCKVSGLNAALDALTWTGNINNKSWMEIPALNFLSLTICDFLIFCRVFCFIFKFFFASALCIFDLI
jgi:hypothetical protein